MARARRARIAGPKLLVNAILAILFLLLSHLGGDPYWDSSVVALLTNKYDGKGQKVPDYRAKSPWVNAILAVLFISEPSW